MRGLRLLVALWVVGNAMWGQDDPVSVGMKALEGEKWAEAASAFEKAVAAEPDEFTSYFHLGLAYSFLNRDAEAESAYRKVLQLKPGLFEAQLNLGQILLRHSKTGEAMALLTSAVEQKPDHAHGSYLLGEALLASGEALGAERRFRHALENDAKEVNAYAGLARSLLQQNKLKESEEAWNKGAEQDGNLKAGLLEVAYRYERAKQFSDAVRIYDQFPEDAAARERAGELRLQLGQNKEALESLRGAVEKSPTAANRYALAIAYLREKDSARAMEQLTEAAKLEPGNRELRLTLGRLLRDDKKFDEAVLEFRRALQLNPQDGGTWSEIAGIEVLQGRYAEALGALDKVAALGFEKPGHIYYRAICLDHLKQIKPAIETYRKFLEASGGKNPDEEFKARGRAKTLENELSKH